MMDAAKAIASQVVTDPFALTPVEVVRAATLYFYNADPIEQLNAAAGYTREWRRDDPYLDEKLGHWRAGLVEWFNRFDHARQERWIAAAIAKYRDDVIAESVLYGRRP